MGKQYGILELGVPVTVSDTPTSKFMKHLYPLVTSDMFSYSYNDVSTNKKFTKSALAALSTQYPGVQVLDKYSLNDSDETNESVADLVVLSKAAANASDISKTLERLKDMLTEDGFLLIHESVKTIEEAEGSRSRSASNAHDGSRSRTTSGINDNDRSRTGSLIGGNEHMSLAAWKKVLKEVGYEFITSYLDDCVDESVGTMLLLAKKVPFTGAGSVIDLSCAEEVITKREQIRADVRQLMVADDFGFYAFVRSLRKEPGYSGLRISYSPISVDIRVNAVNKISSLPIHWDGSAIP